MPCFRTNSARWILTTTLGIAALLAPEVNPRAVAAIVEKRVDPLLLPALFPRHEKTANELFDDLRSPHESTVIDALANLAKSDLAAEPALPTIRKLLTDPREKVRRKAARVLGLLHAPVDQEDLDAICAMFTKAPEETIDALKALRGLDAPTAVPKILPLLQNRNPNVVRDACRTLAVLGTQDNIPSIEPLLTRSDKAIKEDARVAIETLKVKLPSSGSAPGRSSSTKPFAYGTGFIVAAGGYVMTCEHVVAGAITIHIRDQNGHRYPANVVASDRSNDLSLLHAPGFSGSAIPTAPPGAVVIGQSVFCLGYPLQGAIAENAQPAVSSGVIASLRGLHGDTRHIQITMAINPGNSGGPVFDERGRWVGVVSHKLGDLYALQKTGQLAQGFNFAVKNSLAWPLFDAVPSITMPVEQSGEKLALEDLVKRLSDSVVLVISER